MHLAYMVVLPDGTELEAIQARRQGGRSAFVHEHMRGATPPNVYEPALREKTFHGFSVAPRNLLGRYIFKRSGLLAHTYMLGPKGESNVCVVFENYNVFLGISNGQVKRLIVVESLNRTSKVTVTVDQDFAANRVFGCDEFLVLSLVKFSLQNENAAVHINVDSTSTSLVPSSSR